MAKLNARLNGRVYKVCEKHQAYGQEDLDAMFNCADCRCMGANPTDQELIDDTEQDVDNDDLSERVNAARIV
jgi:hypothetical protein